jgi:hypothetical protein
MAGQKRDLQFLLSLIENRQITSWDDLLDKRILIKAVRAYRGKACSSGDYLTERWKLYRRLTNPKSVENQLITASMNFEFFDLFVFDSFILNRAWSQACQGCETLKF